MNMNKSKLTISLIAVFALIFGVLYFMQDFSIQEKSKWSGLFFIIFLPLCFFASKEKRQDTSVELPGTSKAVVIKLVSVMNILFSAKYLFALSLELVAPTPRNSLDWDYSELFIPLVGIFFLLILVSSVYSFLRASKVDNSKQNISLYASVLVCLMFLITIFY